MCFQLLASLAWLLLSPSNAQTVGAFYSTKGPTLISMDLQQGNFVYNTYSQKGFSTMKSFAPTLPAKNGTSIACVGYASALSVYGAIFYQTSNNTLAQQFFKCSYASGICVNYGGYVVSNNVSVPVKPGTGLSAALLSTDLGYRVTYEDIYGSVRQIGYSNSTKGIVTPWADGYLTTNMTSQNGTALGTAYIPQVVNSTSPAEQTIYQLVGNQVLPFVNSNTTALNKTQDWVANPAITNLPNWNSANATFSTIMHSDWWMLFYVDMKRQLQWVRSTDQGTTWQVQPPMDQSIWPLADTPNAPVAAATSTTVNATADDITASVFYVSGGIFVQSILANWTWQNYTLVQASSNTTTNLTAPLRPVERERGIKIGASTGAIIGLLIVVGIVVWCLMLKRKGITMIEKPESIGEWRESESDFNGKAELHGHSAHLFELDHDPECLLLHQLQLFRMYEMRGGIPVELQNSEAGRAELDHTLCKCELDASVMYELPTAWEKEEGMIVVESSRGKEVAVSLKELPDWTWEASKNEGDKDKEEETEAEKTSPEEEV